MPPLTPGTTMTNNKRICSALTGLTGSGMANAVRREQIRLFISGRRRTVTTALTAGNAAVNPGPRSRGVGETAGRLSAPRVDKSGHPNPRNRTQPVAPHQDKKHSPRDKGIVTALAALVALTGSALADGVASRNVVGYLAKESVAGFNFYAPMFEPINAADGIDIQKITLGEGATSWADDIQVLDEGGSTIATYVYATAAESGLDSDGWIDMDTYSLAEVSLIAGQSVIVETANDDVLITYSGQVCENSTPVTSVAGFNFVGNISPVAIDIQQITLDASATSWADDIQILDEGGSTIATYVYATAAESGLDSDGWIDMDTYSLAEVSLEPGLGFIVETANDDVTITLPGTTL